MFAPRYTWGIVPLILSVVLLGGLVAVGVFLMPEAGSAVRTVVLPAVAAGLGIAALFAGHVSYPRVHNLKVYLAGYLVGVFAIAYAVFVGVSPHLTLPTPSAGLPTLLVMVTLVNLVAITVVPAVVGFRATRLITWITVAVEVLALGAARLFPAQFWFIDKLVSGDVLSYQNGVVLILFLLVIVGNAAARPPGFHLSGLFAGLSLVVAGGYVAAQVVPELFDRIVVPGDFMLLATVAAPTLLIVGVIMHVLARMEHRSLYDPLLQIYNREYCGRILEEQTGVNTRPPFGVMLLDIDHFKRVNDRFGHQAGDKVLFAVAQEVQKNVIPHGVLCRYGGEELIAFFPGRSAADLVPLAQRVRTAVEASSVGWEKTKISVTVSIGLSERSSGRQQLDMVVRAADKALYIAKERGRNQVRFVRLKTR